MSVTVTEDDMWTLKVSRRVVRRFELSDIPMFVWERIEEVGEMLRANPEGTVRMLEKEKIICRVKGKTVRRIRVGDYRIFFYIDYERKEIVITSVKHRRHAYKP